MEICDASNPSVGICFLLWHLKTRIVTSLICIECDASASAYVLYTWKIFNFFWTIHPNPKGCGLSRPVPVNGRRYYRDRKRYEIGYCNTDNKLLEEFSKDVFDVYKIKVRKRKFTVLVFKSKRVYSRIKELGGGDTRDWRIGDDVLQSKKRVKSFWLRAFFVMREQ